MAISEVILMAEVMANLLGCDIAHSGPVEETVYLLHRLAEGI